MSVDTPMDANASEEPPLYERDVAAVDRIADLVLLVLTTTNKDELPHDVLIPSVVTLVEDYDAFDLETESAGVDAFDELELLASLDYVEDAPRDPNVETVALTDRGQQGATALVAGLNPDAQAALTEVTTT